MTLARQESKGWTGYLSLPREVFLMTKHNVIRALRTPLEDIPCLKVVEGVNAMSTVQSLGIRPLPSLSALRTNSLMVWRNMDREMLMGRLASCSSTSWILEAVMCVKEGHRRVGFHIHHNETMSHRTSIWFSPGSETIFVDRSHSNSEADIGKHNLSGPFTPFVCDDSGVEVMEKLRLRIFVDGDILEVFANNRFALSTVVYIDFKTFSGVSRFVEGGKDDGPVAESITLWEEVGRGSKYIG